MTSTEPRRAADRSAIEPSRRVTAVVIGGGHCGLAMSRCLSERAIDHVVLERGTVANSWKTERWDSLRLLTPNWLSRLPGFEYDGDDPDGFMDMPEVIAFIERYAATISAPVLTETTVSSVRCARRRLRRDHRPRCLAMPCCRSCERRLQHGLGPRLRRCGTHRDRHAHAVGLPQRRPTGRRRGVGGRRVCDRTAVGRRDPPVRTSGDDLGRRTMSGCRARTAARTSSGGWTPPVCSTSATTKSTMLSGHARCPPHSSSEHRTARMLDLNALTQTGVEIRGRMGTIRHGTALFSGGLRNQCKLADLKMNRLLDTIDEWAVEARSRRARRTLTGIHQRRSATSR